MDQKLHADLAGNRIHVIWLHIVIIILLYIAADAISVGQLHQATVCVGYCKGAIILAHSVDSVFNSKCKFGMRERLRQIDLSVQIVHIGPLKLEIVCNSCIEKELNDRCHLSLEKSRTKFLYGSSIGKLKSYSSRGRIDSIVIRKPSECGVDYCLSRFAADLPDDDIGRNSGHVFRKRMDNRCRQRWHKHEMQYVSSLFAGKLTS